MKINKLNYENFVIDYIEGTLSVELKRDFDLFLEKNEEVYEEIKDYISAPVLEESNETFINKKSLRKTESLGRFLLLAFIPILLLCAYFLIPNKAEPLTPKNNIPTEEIINQFAQEKTIQPKKKTIELKQELKTGILPEPQKTSIKKEPLKTTSKDKKTKTTPVYFASNNSNTIKSNKIFASQATKKEASKELKTQVVLENIASVKTLPLNVLESKNNLKLERESIASILSSEMNTKEKNTWLEMVTPASFADIDIKESLALESNVNINTSRKILNAFIPESLIK